MLTILLIEDDEAILDMLGMFLAGRRYEVWRAPDGETAREILDEKIPDLILLDWMLPDTDGLEILRRIRRSPQHAETPVLMLTARAAEEDKIKGLDVGADDYMIKPVSLKELDARIRALIRRAHGHDAQQRLRRGPIELDHPAREVFINGERVEISGRVYRLLHFFMKNPGRLYSREQLLDHVWGQTTYIEERTVDVHVMRLRKILKSHGVERMLKTERGSGYRFAPED